MIIQSVTLHLVNMPLMSPFVTSYGAYTDRETIIIEMKNSEGHIGWGECVAFATPWYTEETTETAWHILQQFLIPSLLGVDIEHPEDTPQLFKQVKRHHMAKAGLEMAVWDLFARAQQLPLSQLIGGTQREIDSGVAVGLQSSDDELFQVIDNYLSEGYKRVKVKIKPGMDVELISSIRQQFPDLQLMADANSAYSLKDSDHLKQLDPFNLLMIEQPLGDDDIVDHAQLQQSLTTPICLDESILSYDDARKAIELGSCKVINIKIGRVGGMTEAKRIHDLCMAHGIGVWCGGMLETGIGRAHNIALSSLPNFTIPGDISASSRYWERDIIMPEVEVNNGKIIVPNKPGIGFEIDYDFLETVTINTAAVSLK